MKTSRIVGKLDASEELIEHIDNNDATKVIDVIALLHRRCQQLALDPVLNIVGLQTCDAGYLAQGQPTRKEQ